MSAVTKGEILQFMQARAPVGQHHGFEPIPELAHGLAAAFAKTLGVHIHQLALRDREGMAAFH